MKIQSKYRIITISAVLFVIVLGVVNQQIQAQSDNKIKRLGINTKLAEEIKSTLKTNENAWILEKETEPANFLNLSFKLNEKKLIVSVNELGTAQEAIEKFKEAGDISRVSVAVHIKIERNFADQSMLRITNLQGGSMINYCFRQGIYMVSIWGEEKDARRFAEHVLAVIKNQKENH